jgi:asparagine synthase (glutamine-hydrolysing)
LSGDAGDELFGGYERYFVGRSLWNKISWMPPAMKNMTAAALTALPPRVLNGLGAKVLPKRLRHIPLGDKLHKLAEVVAAPGMETLYLNLMSHWKKPGDRDRRQRPRHSDHEHRLMAARE